MSLTDELRSAPPGLHGQSEFWGLAWEALAFIERTVRPGMATLETGAGNITGTGNALDNTITGNEGNNTLTGGAGLDTLTGNGGVDTFVFGAGDTSAVYAQRDIITDFTLGTDKIDLSGIDANTLVAGMDGFRFNGWAGFDGTAGALRLRIQA